MTQNGRDIKLIEDYVVSLFETDTSGHDWLHIERVKNTAIYLAHQENIENTDVIEASCLLHEIFDYKLQEHIGRISEQNVQSILEDAHFNKCEILQILGIIKNCSWSKEYFEELESDSIEINIVRDADKLDSLGAIGIARSFMYGFKNVRPAFKPGGTAKEYRDLQQYRKENSDSTIHHIIERMLKVQGMLRTKAARQIAEERHNLTLTFLNHFIFVSQIFLPIMAFKPG